MKNQKTEKHFFLFALSIIAIISTPILYFIIRYGVDIPYWDQWDYVGFFEHFSKGTLTLKELFIQQNENRQLFPNILFVFLGRVTNWNVRFEMIIIFIMACIISFNIFRLSEKTFEGGKWQKWFLLILTNLIIFSPAQFENWLFGVQIVYFVPIICITTGLIICSSKLNDYFKILFCIILSTISTFSIVNGFLCWIVIFPILINSVGNIRRIKKWPVIKLWIITAILSLIIYFYDYHSPRYHPSSLEIFHYPIKALFYFFNVLGNPLGFGNVLFASRWCGFFIFSSFIFSVFYLIKNFRDKILITKALPWVMLGFYSLLTGIMITVGRVGFGIEQSLSSRYQAFTLYLLLSVIYLIPMIIEHRSKYNRFPKLPKNVFSFLYILLIMTQIFIYPFSVKNMKVYYSSIQKAKAGILFIRFIPHSNCVKKIYPGNFALLEKRAELLDSLGYLRPGLIKSNVIEEIEGTDYKNVDFGVFDKLEIEADNSFSVSGIARLPYRNEAADAILFTYENKNSQAVLFALDNTGNLNWEKTISRDEIPSAPLRINAWAFDAKTGKAYRLKKDHVLTR